jgi:hypothetical protein
VEHGIKCFHEKRRAFVFGSNALEWLLSFSPCDWSDICMLQTSRDGSFPQAVDDLSLKVHVRMKVKVPQRNEWATLAATCNVLLGAGTDASMSAMFQCVGDGVPAIMFASERGRRHGALSRLLQAVACHAHTRGTTPVSHQLCLGNSATCWTILRFRSRVLVSRHLLI